MADDTMQHGIRCNCGETFSKTEKLENHLELQELELKSDYTPRRPRQEELEKIVQWYIDNVGYSQKEAQQTIEQWFYVVIDNYQTGCPGYAGKILIEIGSAAPSHYKLYTTSKTGELTHRTQAKSLRTTAGEQ